MVFKLTRELKSSQTTKDGILKKIQDILRIANRLWRRGKRRDEQDVGAEGQVQVLILDDGGEGRQVQLVLLDDGSVHLTA